MAIVDTKKGKADQLTNSEETVDINMLSSLYFMLVNMSVDISHVSPLSKPRWTSRGCTECPAFTRAGRLDVSQAPTFKRRASFTCVIINLAATKLTKAG